YNIVPAADWHLVILFTALSSTHISLNAQQSVVLMLIALLAPKDLPKYSSWLPVSFSGFHSVNYEIHAHAAANIQAILDKF
ncbi:hypothetical protein ACJX0J_009799, partial [Zea mays]